MSKDKMREDQMRAEFELQNPRFAGLIEMEKAGACSHLDAISARHCFAVYKACAESYEKKLAEKDAEIEARGLMINELLLSAEDRGLVINGLILERDRSTQRKKINSESNSDLMADDCARLIGHFMNNELFAKSEHHNSKALEEMMLEAEIDGLINTEREFNIARLEYCKAKLAELNKG